MGDKWIEGNLKKAVSTELYDELMEIRDLSPDDIGNYLFNIQKNGQIDLIRLKDGEKLN